MSRVAMGAWRDQSKAGKELANAIVNTSSTSGLIGSPGQTNYGAAKAAIASLTMIMAMESKRIVIRIKNTQANNHHVWVDVLPLGSFLPPKEGANDYTVLDHNYGDDQTKVYQRGGWEKTLRQALNDKK